MKIFNKNLATKILRCTAIFCLIFVLCRASVAQKISPFGIAFAFALVANQIYPITSCLSLFASMALSNLSIVGLVVAATYSAVLLVYYIVSRASGNKKTYLAIIFCLLSSVAKIYFSTYSLESIIYACSQTLCSSLLCYSFSRLVFAIICRGAQGLTSFDKLRLSVMFFAIGCGLTNIKIADFDVTKLIILSTIFVFSTLGHQTILYSLMACVGTFCYNFISPSLTVYLVSICIGQIPQSKNKWIYSGIVCFVDGALIYFARGTITMFIPTIVSIIIYLCIPQKLLTKTKQYIFGSNKSIIPNFLFERKSVQTKNKLLTMSMMFQEMQNCYKNSIFLNRNTQKRTNLLAYNIKSKMCANCINRLQCSDNKDIIGDIAFLIDRAQEKEKVTLLDVPNLLASNCNKLNAMLANINAAAEECKKNDRETQEQAEEKLATGMQMAGTSEIFKELSNQFEINWLYNQKKSFQIKEKLIEMGIVCRECTAIEDGNGINSIIMLVRGVDSVNPDILLACKAIYHTDFERSECLISRLAGWNIVIAKPKEHYEVICGVASKSKNDQDKNGDNYIFTKIGEHKYLVAISDGMGHGENANNISETTIKLIESYYKCGFDDNLVTGSINQMLLPLSSTFSTLDVAIIDSFSGSINFIKQGSSISVIKKENKSMIVDVESLPLGALEDTKPSMQVAVLSAGDIVVLASDGVVDSFGEDEFCNYINNERALNMQFFAESILDEAASRQSEHKDDMTVIAIKIAQNR